MLRLGVPEYRLPRALIQLEINAILSLGVELTTNARLGHEFTLADLRAQGYAAVFLGVGAMRSRDLAVEGIDLDGVLKGIDYLLNINLGYKVEMGRRVLVIGGGNVALDVARVAARGGEQENLQRNLSVVQALDVARSAIRFGAREVTVCSLESEREMPAAPDEIEEALREGIRFRHGLGPNRFVGEGGKVTGVEFRSVSRVFDEQGRFSPQFIEGSESIVAADTVIVSIGQTGDFSFLRPEDGIETRGGRIVIDPKTLATTAKGIYAGGDAAFGPRIAINAVADGKRAAKSIDELLRGRPRPEFEGTVEIAVHPRYERTWDFEGIPRQKPPTRPIERRIGIAEVEECFAGDPGAPRGEPVPAMLDEHGLRRGRGSRHRVHPVRRLPGHLPGGLHRDRAGRDGSRDARGRPRARPDPDRRPPRGLDPDQERGDLHSLRPLRRPLPRRNHHDAEFSYRGGRHCLTERTVPCPRRRPPIRNAATSSPGSASAPAPRPPSDPVSSRSTS